MNLLALVSLALLQIIPAAGLNEDQPVRELMSEVLENRKADWKARQDYLFFEKETARLRGNQPGEEFFGLDREYNWYVRDGYLVRSPHRIDGVLVTSEEQKREYEDNFIKEQKRREGEDKHGLGADEFFGYDFEDGEFYLAGRDTWNERPVLVIDFIPHAEITGDTAEMDIDDRIEAQVDSSMTVTMYVLPEEKRIVRMILNNVGYDFMPGRWLVQVDDISAVMEMTEAFPGVWLPDSIRASATTRTAEGPIYVSYQTEFSEFKRSEVEVQFYLEPQSSLNRNDEDEESEERK